MRIPRFSAPILFSFLLAGLLVPMKHQSAQAGPGPGQFTDGGAGNFFSGGTIDFEDETGFGFAPGLSVRSTPLQTFGNDFTSFSLSEFGFSGALGTFRSPFPPGLGPRVQGQFQPGLAVFDTNLARRGILQTTIRGRSFQLGQFTDEGAGNFGSRAFTIASNFISQFTAFGLVAKNEIRELEETNPNIANVLTDSSAENADVIVSKLTDAGVPKAKATQLVQSVEGVFQPVSQIDTAELKEGDIENNLELKRTQSKQFITAVTEFNNVLNSLDSEVRQNPPEELLAINSALSEASQATRVAKADIQNN